MKFESGSRIQDLTMTIRPTRHHEVNGVTFKVNALQIQFNNGVFDSEEWQKNAGASDEDREAVEAKIMSSQSFGEFPGPRNIWIQKPLEQRAEPGPTVPEEELAPCSHIDIIDGVSKPCPKKAVPGMETCDDHVLESATLT